MLKNVKLFYHNQIQNISLLLLLIVVASHAYTIYQIAAGSLTTPIAPRDEILYRFRPFEIMLRFLTEPKFDINAVAMLWGTIVLCVLVAIAVIRIRVNGFWWLTGLIILFGLGGIASIVIYYTKTGYEVPFSLFIEVAGWFSIILGLITDRRSKHQLWEPIVLREIGLLLLAAASLLYKKYLWADTTVGLVLFGFLGLSYLTHFINLCVSLRDRQAFRPDMTGVGQKVSRGAIAAVPTVISVVALYYSWRSNQLNETANYPEIEVAGQNSISAVRSTQDGSIVLCRQEIVVNNIGRSGTSITEVDLVVAITEPSQEPSRKKIGASIPSRKLSRKEIDAFIKEVREVHPAAKVSERKIVQLAEDYFTYSNHIRHTQDVHSVFPAYKVRERNDLGVDMIYVWGTQAPSTSKILRLYEDTPFMNEPRIVDLSAETTLDLATLDKPIYEQFADLPAYRLPTFLSPNSSTPIYVDTLTLTKPVEFANRRETSFPVTPLNNESDWVPNAYVDMKNLRQGNIEVRVEALLHFTNHDPVVVPDYRALEADCQFANVKIPTP